MASPYVRRIPGSKQMRSAIVTWLVLLALTVFHPATAAPARAQVWQRRDHALTSTRHYENPYTDLTLRVTYTGPGGHTLRTYGFWDGADSFRIRSAFPTPGTWR